MYRFSNSVPMIAEAVEGLFNGETSECTLKIAWSLFGIILADFRLKFRG